jgi:hypothetical protein
MLALFSGSACGELAVNIVTRQVYAGFSMAKNRSK